MCDTAYVGTRKGLFTFKRTGANWEVDRVDFLGHPVTMMLEDQRNGTLYACLTLGHFGTKLHRSTDRGRHWDEIAVPTYPAGAVIASPAVDDSAPPATKPASLSEVWALETAGDDQPDALWAGTIPGGLFRSEDAGATWTLNERLWQREERMQWFGGGKDDPGIHSICVDPRDSRHIPLGVSCGGLWGTKDTGQSWDLIGDGLRAEFMPPDAQFDKGIQDAHRLAQSNTNPDEMWVQHHNGIFHSTDGSNHYREISQAGPSTFGFAAVAHPRNPGTAWFVPAVKDECRVPVDAQLVVTRTRDGGASFETLRSGLPQQHCYDIVFRHGLDCDESGQQLVMGSSTGGLWFSENEGDDWSLASNTLPQIYVVRFSRRW